MKNMAVWKLFSESGLFFFWEEKNWGKYTDTAGEERSLAVRVVS